jgi:hypothetical protein
MDEAGWAVDGHGGEVTGVRPKGASLLTSMPFNHLTHRLRKLCRRMVELATVDVEVNDPHTWMLHHGRLDLARARGPPASTRTAC